MLKRIIIFMIVFAIIAVIINISVFGLPFVWKKYQLEDYGISLKVPRDFVSLEKKSDSNILYLYDNSKDYSISVTALGENFWKSGDFDVIKDQYIRLMSAAKYEYAFKDIATDDIVVNNTKIAKVDMTLENPTSRIRTISILTNNKYNNIAIEFYGLPETIELNKRTINKIINTMTFGENKHPKSSNTKTNNSGDYIVFSGEKMSGDTLVSGDVVLLNDNSGEITK